MIIKIILFTSIILGLIGILFILFAYQFGVNYDSYLFSIFMQMTHYFLLTSVILLVIGVVSHRVLNWKDDN